jgi:hypothetical protein
MNDTELTVKEQCELLSINRSTLYYKPKEPQETAIEREEYIKSRIDYWHTKFCVFGHRRIREKLRRRYPDWKKACQTIYGRNESVYGLSEAKSFQASKECSKNAVSSEKSEN